VNIHHVGHLPSSVRAARAGHASVVAVTQAGNELAAQFATWVSVDSRVDGFVRYVLGWTRRIIEPKCARYLLGRPLPVQQREYDPPANALHAKLGGAATRPTAGGAQRLRWH